MPWWWPKKRKSVATEYKYAAAYYEAIGERLDAVEAKYGPNGIVDLVRDVSVGQLGQFRTFATEGFSQRDGHVLGPPSESEFPAWADFREDLVFQSQYYRGLQSYVEAGPEANKQLVLLLYIGHFLDIMAVKDGAGILYLAPDAAGAEKARRTFGLISPGFEARHEFQTYHEVDERLLRSCIILCDLDWTEGSRVDGMVRERAPGFIARLLKNEKARQVFMHQHGATSVVPTPLMVEYRERYPAILDAATLRIWREIFPQRLEGWHRMLK